MQALSFGRAPVPSPAVLRFLRIQAECLPFLASHSQVRRNHHHAQDTVRLRPLTSTERRASLTSAENQTSALKHRDFWNSAVKSRWQKPWQARQKKTAPLQPNDLPPLPRLLDDAGAASLGRIVKPTNELRMRCTEFDGEGKVTLVNGAFKKSELIAKCGLLPRDLRKIDSASLPHILVRPSAILIKILHISCLINHNRVLVFDAYGTTDSHTQSIFMYDLEGKLQLREGRSAGSLPYEFRALEAVLISVTSALEGEFEGVREPVVQVLRELEEDIDRNKLRHLLIYSKKLGTFEQKARLVRDAIDDLLEADDDLSDMYLTEKANGVTREEDDHTEVEMLLESYHKVCDEIVQASSNLVSNIRNTEEIVKAILDANRNSLMLLDLQFTILALGIGVGTFFAGLYGMNLKNFIEETDFGFPLVSISCGFFCMVAIVWGLRKLRKVQRLSMWGESGSLSPENHGRRGRGSWREVDPQNQLSGENRVDRTVRWKQDQRMNKMQEGSNEAL
ncbi:cora-domain-containing protein [Aureobasidium pullulans]|nr:cora-domain-containing protein [Aureobasidium pullulans]